MRKPATSQKESAKSGSSAFDPPQGLLLGAHVSIAGSVHRAFVRGEEAGCTVIQVFTKNASRWEGRPLTENDVREFKREQNRTGLPVIAHDAYLINMASPDVTLRERSVRAFREELERAERLEIPFLVMHPGAHTGSGEEAGIAALIGSFNVLLRDTSGFQVKILVENTAGQGTALGYKFEHLNRLVNDPMAPERMGICIDTCHLFAAGYDLRDRESYERTWERLDEAVGLSRLQAIHVNDCKKGLGSRVDRHEHIGRGTLGLEPFRFIMNDPRLGSVPKIIETPKQDCGTDMDPVNLALLRSLVVAKPRSPSSPG